MQMTNIFQPPLPTTQEKKITWTNLYGASIGLVINQTIIASHRPILIITHDELAVSRLIDELHFFGNKIDHLLHFPDRETLPYDHFSPHQDIISERLSALHRLPTLQKGAVITTISTLIHRLPPRDYLEANSFLLKIGDKLNIDILRTQLTNVGYHSVGQVREHGEFAIRGSIIDLFPMGSKIPFRIDLLDNEVDSI